MSEHVIKVPDIGEGIAEVELVAWHVAPGDSIVAEQAVADVMTDKATVEIPAHVSGRVISLGGRVGEKLAVGSVLLKLESGANAAGADPAESPSAAADRDSASARSRSARASAWLRGSSGTVASGSRTTIGSPASTASPGSSSTRRAKPVTGADTT